MSIHNLPLKAQFLEAADVPRLVDKLSMEFSRVDVAMAFLTKGGYAEIKSPLGLDRPRELGRKRGRIRLLVGLSTQLGITEVEPLQRLLDARESAREHKGVAVRYFDSPRFHPKVFVFRNKKEAAIIVGSSNLTSGGMSGNKEANLFVRGRTTYGALEQAVTYFNNLWSSKDNQPETLTRIRVKQYGKAKSSRKINGRGQPKKGKSELPPGKLSRHSAPPGRSMAVFIDGIEYPVDSIGAYCSVQSCRSPAFSIPLKWWKDWYCNRHGDWTVILRKRRGVAPSLRGVSGDQAGEKVEVQCNGRSRGRPCKTRVDITNDFTQMICRGHYDLRKKNHEKCFTQPERGRSRLRIHYDVSKKEYYKKSNWQGAR